MEFIRTRGYRRRHDVGIHPHSRMEASLEAHQLLLTNISARAEDARGQLIRIGRELCGEEFESYLTPLGDLEYVSAEELASHMINSLKSHSAKPRPMKKSR